MKQKIFFLGLMLVLVQVFAPGLQAKERDKFISIINDTGQPLYYAFGNTSYPPEQQPVSKVGPSTLFTTKRAKAKYGTRKGQASMVILSFESMKPGDKIVQYSFDPSKAVNVYVNAVKSGNRIVLKPRTGTFGRIIKGNITADRIAAEEIIYKFSEQPGSTVLREKFITTQPKKGVYIRGISPGTPPPKDAPPPPLPTTTPPPPPDENAAAA